MSARSHPAPFAASLLTHALLLAWVASGPPRDKPESIYRQTIAPHESKIVWYDFRKKLPDVSPAGEEPDSKPPRADVKLESQEIVAGSAKAPRARQFVWQPAPKVELKRDLKSPNLLALVAPRLEPPPKPKRFVPPPEVPRPAPPPPDLDAPPQIQMTVALPPAPRPQPRKFVPPEVKKAVPAAPKLDAPPEIRMARSETAPGAIGNLLGARPARPQPRAFVVPRAGQASPATAPALPAPPSVQAGNVSAMPAAPFETGIARPARRAFVPSGGVAKPSPFGPSLADAPALAAADAGPNVGLVIVGLNPSAIAPPLPPEGSRDAQLSGGPQPRAHGGAGAAVEGATLVVPGLLIRGGAPDTKPAWIARAAPTSAENLRAAIHGGLPDPSIAGPHPAAVRVSSAPDPMFEGRPTYAMTVQMPNTTSYSGSWMIWFAEHERTFGQTPGISPPVPVRKVDPKYIASAMDDRIEGNVRLAAVIRTDGHVDSVKLLRRLDDRLDRSAVEAMDKWQFEPALRNGKPVALDAVIEIPFRLAPRTTR